MLTRCIRAAAHVAAVFIVALIFTSAGTSFAQSHAIDSPPATAPVSREEFERRLKEIQDSYMQDIAARDKAIADLQQQLAARPTSQAEAEEHAKAHEQHVHDLLAQIDEDATLDSTLRTPVSFNPDFAVVSDFLGTWSNDRANPAYNRLDVREVELDLRAAVHPMADAVAILAFARDVENPVFPNGEFADEVETGSEIEEAYLFLHDFGIENLTATLGRFHVRFGRQNVLHLHDLPTSDHSLVNQAFLAPEALVDSGVSLSYLIPNPWNQYFEVVVQVLAGEGGGSESPTLSGDISVDSPAINVHALWNKDITANWNMELGGSYLHGPSSPDNDLDINLFGADLTFLRTDPGGGFNNLLLQSEFMYGSFPQNAGDTQHSWGAYLLAQQQINRDWYAGVRLDYTQNPGDSSQSVWAASPYVSWYWSEFLRFRVEYQHRGGDEDDQDVVMFQVTWIFGAHPPHPYWAMR